MLSSIMKIKEEKGFTLIEIMVVLVILGVLAAISVPVYSNYVRKAKLNEAISNVEAVANAIRIYRMETGKWPTKNELLVDTKTKAVNIDEYYFTLSWAVPGTAGATLGIVVTATDKFDSPGSSFTYTIDNNYTGKWVDGQSGGLLATYANYLLRT